MALDPVGRRRSCKRFDGRRKAGRGRGCRSSREKSGDPELVIRVAG